MDPEMKYQYTCGIVSIIILVFLIFFLWWAWPRFDRATSNRVDSTV